MAPEWEDIIERDEAYAQRWSLVKPVYIDEVDASDSGIGFEGFKYFRECRELRILKLNHCDFVDDQAIRILSSGRAMKTLKELVNLTQQYKFSRKSLRMPTYPI